MRMSSASKSAGQVQTLVVQAPNPVRLSHCIPFPRRSSSIYRAKMALSMKQTLACKAAGRSRTVSVKALKYADELVQTAVSSLAVLLASCVAFRHAWGQQREKGATNSGEIAPSASRASTALGRN
jgi:hypothetical protein